MITMDIPTNDRTYEPLMGRTNLTEKKYLKSMGFDVQPRYHSFVLPDEFKKEKALFFTKYLLKQPAALQTLGLTCPEVPMPSSPTVDMPKAEIADPPEQGLGNAHRKTPHRKKPLLLPPESVLSTYFEQGIEGMEENCRLPTRDAKGAKSLLKAAAAAWTSSLERKLNKQLNLNIPPDLMKRIDEANDRLRLGGTNITKTQMIINVLNSTYSGFF